MSSEDEEQNLRHDVSYLRFLLESGLSEEEIREIAKEKNPKLEVCFSEEACMNQSKMLERGRYIVLIS
jgi:collagenase-like PrtC family protease